MGRRLDPRADSEAELEETQEEAPPAKASVLQTTSALENPVGLPTKSRVAPS